MGCDASATRRRPSLAFDPIQTLEFSAVLILFECGHVQRLQQMLPLSLRVIAGLGPAIHPRRASVDARIKSGHGERRGGQASVPGRYMLMRAPVNFPDRQVTTAISRGSSERRLRWVAGLFVLLAAAGAAVAEPIDPIDRAALFRRYDPDYDRRAAQYRPLIETKAALLAEREGRGEKSLCAQEILRETQYLAGSTADWKLLERRLADLDAALAAPAEEGAETQDGAGAWGRCYTVEFLKLDASYDNIAALSSRDTKPPIRTQFLDRFNDPDRLAAVLRRLAVSDIAQEGVDHRRELNETLSSLIRLVRRGWPIGYDWAPGVKERLYDLIRGELRDPATGYWGAAYRTETGAVVRTSDLSITYHVAKYLNGRVGEWPTIIATTLAIKDRRYPRGWLTPKGYMNHHNMDVVELFRMGWPDAGPEQREAIRAEIGRMLDWCLAQSVTPEGGFRMDGYDDSLEASYYFGTTFLVRAGFFDKKHRFWTEAEFPTAGGVKARLLARLESLVAEGAGGSGGFYYRNALAELRR
jgi:hypothetical protein